MAVRPQGYQPQTNPGGSPRFRGADGDAFGAQIGHAVQRLGSDIAQAEETKRRVDEHNRKLAEAEEQDQQLASGSVASARLSGDMSTFTTDARLAAQPGAPGHTDAVLAEFDRRSTDILKPITNVRARERLQVNLEEMRARLEGTEHTWEATKKVDNLVTNAGETTTQLSASVAADPSKYGEAMGMVTTLWGGLQGVPPEVGDKGLREARKLVTKSFATSLADKDPELALGFIANGSWNDMLDAGEISAVRETAQAEVRRRESAAASQAAHAKAEALQTLNLFQKKIGDGYEPKPEEFDAMSALAAANELPGEQWDTAVSRAKINVNRETRDWPAQRYEQEINRLEAKGDKRTPAESVTLQQLRTIAPARMAAFNSNYDDFAARAGRPAPALNSQDPSSFERRASWAEAARKADGLTYTPYMTDQELKPFADRAAQGPVGVLQVAQELRGAWGGDKAAEIMKRIQPNDPFASYVATLPGPIANLAVRGATALKGNHDLVDDATVREVLNENLTAIPPHLRPAVQQLSRDIAAGMLDANNRTKFDEGTFRMAVQRAMGAQGGPGGLVGGIGEINDNPIWLPQGASSADAEKRLYRSTPVQFARAAGNHVPHWGDPKGNGAGRSLTVGEFRTLKPESVGQGLVQFRGPTGRVIINELGEPYVLDIGKLK